MSDDEDKDIPLDELPRYITALMERIEALVAENARLGVSAERYEAIKRDVTDGELIVCCTDDDGELIVCCTDDDGELIVCCTDDDGELIVCYTGDDGGDIGGPECIDDWCDASIDAARGEQT
jgi:hypothetical protein